MWGVPSSLNRQSYLISSLGSDMVDDGVFIWPWLYRRDPLVLLKKGEGSEGGGEEKRGFAVIMGVCYLYPWSSPCAVATVVVVKVRSQRM